MNDIGMHMTTTTQIRNYPGVYGRRHVNASNTTNNQNKVARYLSHYLSIYPSIHLSICEAVQCHTASFLSLDVCVCAKDFL